ncbi:hypothetical protein N657DRAFT_678528 [Parathielavia appendiculata]|uniref:MARVEL domain-containing protein n=1 Tax=Parathielavia appendiculata TaxID=2587402 RepID=A0AAN6Z5X8_9PEZI|nr:hypothetical protein N657DRAFT_678528 [Parathielavia appendiculata]
MYRAISLGMRAVLFLCGVTVLGLAAAMIKNQVVDSPPVTTRYSTFTGGFGMIVCGVGALGLFVSFIPALVPIVLDGLAGLLFLGGGIAWTIGLRSVENCSNYYEMLRNPLLNQGSIGSGEDTRYGIIGPDDGPDAIASKLLSNCQRARADEVLQFICFALALGLVGLGVVGLRKGKVGGGEYVV